MGRIGMSDEQLKAARAQGKIQIMPDYKTLRDEFAMAAMTGMVQNSHDDGSLGNVPDTIPEIDAIAIMSYEVADAMLKAREG